MGPKLAWKCLIVYLFIIFLVSLPCKISAQIFLNLVHVYPGQRIQLAIDAANNGDFIIVHPGTYYENIRISDKIITLWSSDLNPANTIIDGNRRGSVVRFYNSSAALNGFTIQNGDSYLGGGIYCNRSYVNIDNCIIQRNSAVKGGGIYLLCSDNSHISSCIIQNNNVSQKGGGIFFNNTTSWITNCLFVGNKAIYSGKGGAIYCYDDYPFDNHLTIINCTFSFNIAGRGSAIEHNNPNVTITNCILWDDDEGEDEIFGYPFCRATVTYSNIQSEIYEGVGNISVDPLFIKKENYGRGDYRLQLYSPCIDAGTNNGAPRVDINDLGRPIDGNLDGLAVCDMGAYERPVFWYTTPFYTP